MLNLKDFGGILNMFETVMSRVMQPMLEDYTWGDLSTTPLGLEAIDQFQDTMRSSLIYMQSMII